VDNLVDAKKLAEVLDLPLQSIWKLARQKQIKTIRIGPKLLRFNVDEVVAALAHDEEEEGK